MNPLRPLFLISWLLFVPYLWGHEFGIAHVTKQDGLPHSIVFWIEEDANGFIWLGTDAGLTRYDGNHFLPVKCQWDSAGAAVTAMYSDEAGNLWAGYYRKGLLRTQIHDPLKVSTQPFPFGYHILSHEGELYFLRKNNIYRIRDTTFEDLDIWEQLMDMWPDGAFSSANITLTAHQSPNYPYPLIGCELGLFELVGDSIRPFAGGLLNNVAIFSMTSDPQGGLWLGSRAEILQVVGSRIVHRYREGLPPDLRIHQLEYDQRGHLWISVPGSGLYRLDTFWKRSVYISPQLGIGETTINFIKEDRAGNVWIATHGEGVFILFPSLFKHYGRIKGLTNGFVTSLAMDPKGRLYIGQSTGVSVLSDVYESVQTVLSQSEAYVFDMLQVGADSLLVSTHTFADAPFYAPGPKDWPGVQLWPSFTIYPLGSAQYLVASNNQESILRLFSIQTKTNQPIPLQPHPSIDRIKTMARFKDGELWIGRRIGLFRARSPIRSPYQLLTDSFPLEASIEGDIYDLYIEGDSVLWVASDVGLYRWNRKLWRHIRTDGGLPHMVCTSLAGDSEGRLWVGTQKGLCLIEGDSLRSFGKLFGLQSEEITTLHYDSIRQSLWIGTSNGLFLLDPRDINTYPS
ncbi:MAG: hypothetical protein D6722_13415, partial [Bacteroidetes bacterium]